MKPFQQQFCECAAAGYHGKGSFESFEDHPEKLPMFPTKKMADAIARGEFKGIQHTGCLRFGGDCTSGHPQCQELRRMQ